MKWLKVPATPTLRPKTIHIWRIPLDINPAQKQTLSSFLSPDELERVSRFHFEKDRLQMIAARAALRQILAQYLDIQPTSIIFQYGLNGKPFFPNAAAIHFNVSHSGKWALIGFVRNFEIGLDIELIRPEVNIQQVARHFFSKGEVEALFALPETQQYAAFFRCWTRKESFIKAKGDGLSFPLDQFEVSLGPQEDAILKHTHWDNDERERWALFDLDVALNYLAAVAVEGAIESLYFYDWQH